ncbi:MAG: sulfatase-like hydrolase/transferase [Candidatus Aminicenantes bacterium]|nr:sulfatase-like hydrolase/transferase [Candidatus Aminicenantes bacterium]
MKLKSLIRVLIFGISVGFIFGAVRAIQTIFSQRYFRYDLHRLILLELTENINRGIVYSLIIVIFSFLSIKAISLFWRKLLSPFFEVRLIKKKKLTPLLKVSSFVILFAYMLIQILKYILDTNQGVQSFLGQSLIVFILFLLILQLEKIDFQLLKSKIFRIFISAEMKITAGVFIAFFVLINILNFGQKLFNPPSGPNVMLIVPDALRPDHLGCYGYSRPTSPQIDKFAADALLFEKAMSNSPWTKPSMGSVFTSIYPYEHKAFSWMDNLPDECLTLAEVFRNRNYATFAIQTNPSITEKHNFKQGFQYYHEMVQEKGEVVTSSFNTWVKKHKKKPFFAYLHYMDTHVPYNAPQEFSQIFGLKDDTLFTPGEFQTMDVRLLGEMGLSKHDKQSLVNLYDAAIKYFDSNFEEIIDNLKKLGILNKTIIILTSDHGEEFWEHDGFAHGHTVYNELLHVPLIIGYSPHLPKRHIKSYVQLLDFFPTVLSLAGIKNDFELRGKDIAAAALANKQINEKILCEGILYGSEKKAILKDGWKLIENTGKKNKETFHPLGDLTKYRYPEYEKGFELYNINQDFSEKHNLTNNYPQIATNLKKQLLAFRMSLPDIKQQRKTMLKEKLDDLKSLGYIK